MRWVVTGANRGLGLEFTRQLAARGDVVEAGARDPSRSAELRALAAASGDRVRVHACDVGDDASVRAFAASIGEVPIDVVLNNAGTMGEMRPLADLDLADVTRTFDVNALGPLRVTRALLPQLMLGETRRVAHVTSGMGSIGDNGSGGAYGYRMSKAALNMMNRSLSVDYGKRGFVCVVVNPGWVQTDMGGSHAPTPVAESVAKMLARLDGLTAADNGTFLDYKGGTYPW
jgi:NAD(P)-dependent dehydrogenase (short-subunit alcohol dehydrogenase family)